MPTETSAGIGPLLDLALRPWSLYRIALSELVGN